MPLPFLIIISNNCTTNSLHHLIVRESIMYQILCTVNEKRNYRRNRRGRQRGRGQNRDGRWPRNLKMGGQGKHFLHFINNISFC